MNRRPLAVVAALGVRQPVDVVNSYGVHLAGGDEIQQKAMGFLEDHRVFHPHGGQLVDFKKAPVVNLVPSRAPECRVVVLFRQQAQQAAALAPCGDRRLIGGLR